MKRVLLKEDDASIFGQTLNPEHNLYFNGNKSEFFTMINEQTIGFWLRYIISLRSALYKKGFVPRKDWRAVFGEEAFINMTELMTELDVQERGHKISERIEDIKLFYTYNFYVSQVGIPAQLAWNHVWLKPALSRIFGKVEDLPKKYAIFCLWTRFAGGLVEIHKHWRKAKRVSSVTDIPWKAPAQWYHHSKCHRVHLFENYLKTKFGDKLQQLVGFETSIAWWNDVEVTAIAKTSMLSRVYPLQTQDHGFTSLDPILSDDDDDDDGGGGGGGGGGSISSSSGGGGGDCDGGGYSSVGDKEVNTLTTQMVAMKVGDCAAQHSMSSQAYTISDGRRTCANCNKPEPSCGTYKRCKRCVEEAFPEPKHYCSKKCQVEDWKKLHKYEHKKSL